MNGMKKVTPSSSSYSNPSSAALRRLFGWIELRYGGNIPMEQNPEVITIPGHQNRIAISDSNNRVLQTEDLVRLLQHDPGVIAIHIKEFYHRETAIKVGKQLMQEASNGNAVQNWNISTNRGLESSDVTTIGAYKPYNIVVASSRGDLNKQPGDMQQKEDEYFIGVQKEHYQRRHKSQSGADSDEPFLWPLDLLRLQLDEAWPSGAGLARRFSDTASTKRSVYNPPYGGGLPRIMYGPTRYAKGFVHVDEMGPLNTRNGLFSANIYLQLPDQNDCAKDDNSSTSIDQKLPQEVLEIWPTRIMNRWDWYRNMLLLSSLSSTDIQDQIRLRYELGCEPVRIAVSPGDLVLFCVQRPHAAMGFHFGTRVSLQCFIQHHGLGQRLLIDS